MTGQGAACRAAAGEAGDPALVDLRDLFAGDSRTGPSFHPASEVCDLRPGEHRDRGMARGSVADHVPVPISRLILLRRLGSDRSSAPPILSARRAEI